MTAESHLDRSVTFRVAGHQYRLSGREILDRARQVLAGGIPPEALRYRNWVVDVDGQPIGVKWLFSLATGLSTNQFNTVQARGVFRRMGIEAQSLEQGALLVSPDVPAKAPLSDELLRADLDRPVEFTVAGHRFRMSGGEVLDHARKALTFGLPPEAQRYRKWVVDVDGQSVGAKWVFGLAIGLAVDQFNVSHARSVLRRMGIEVRSLKQATSPVAPKTSARRRAARRKKPTNDAERRYQLLDAEVRAIRDFLDGNAASRPSDERLCYWVYLCLTFELYREGWQLFMLIDPSRVSKTLYERTNRFAQACRVRAEVQT